MKTLTKQWLKVFAILTLMLTTSMVVNAKVTVKSGIQHGSVAVDKPNATAGETVTITVTPDEGYYAESSNVTLEKTVDPGSANAPGLRVDGPSVGGDTFNPNGSALATHSEPAQYTFIMPEAPYGVLVDAEFQECILLTAEMFEAIADQNWTGHQITPVPVISTTGTNAGLTADYYDLVYGGNVTQTGYVKIHGKGKFTGTVQLDFNILRPSLYLVGSFNNWDEQATQYKFVEQEDGTFKLEVTGWTANSEFKLVDDNNQWYGPTSGVELGKDQLGVAQALSTESGMNNFKLLGAGDWTFTVSADWKTITVTGTWKYNIIYPENLTNGEITHTPAGPQPAGTEISLFTMPSQGYMTTNLTATNVTTGANIELVGDYNTFTMPESDVRVNVEFVKIPTLTLVYSVDNWAHQYELHFTKDANGNFSLSAPGLPSDVSFILKDENGILYHANENASSDNFNYWIDKDKIGTALDLTTETGKMNFYLPVPGDWEITVPADRLSMTVNGTWKYKVTTDVVENTGGSITASPRFAEAGATITVTVAPEDDYQMDHLTMVTTGDNPTSVDFTDNGDGTFTFTMPESDVYVRVKFIKTPKLTLVRTSNADDDWSSTESIPFTKNENGDWVLPEQTWEAGVAFYLQDENGTKYYYAQSSAENEYYNMPKDKVGQWQNLYTGTPRGQYFKMLVAGKWTITVNEARIALKVEGDWGHLITIEANESLAAHTEVVHAGTDTYVEDNRAAKGERVKVVYTPIGDVITVEVKDADGNTVDYDTEDNSFIMPDSPVTITITATIEEYAIIMTQATGEQGYYMEANVENVAKVRPGTTVTVTVTPNNESDFAVVGLVTDPGVEVTDNGDGTFTFTMPRENIHVSATLEAKLQGVEFTADRHWATYIGKYTLQKPEDVTVYEVTGISNGMVQIVELEYIPDYYPVLLYSETSMSDITTPVIANQDESTDASPLLGSVDGTNIQEGDYVLYNDVFVRVSEDGPLAAHRCYIPSQAVNASTPAGAPRFMSIATPAQGGTITAIEYIDMSDVAGVKYVNMQGITSDKPFSGLNIMVITRTDGTTVTRKVVK